MKIAPAGGVKSAKVKGHHLTLLIKKIDACRQAWENGRKEREKMDKLENQWTEEIDRLKTENAKLREDIDKIRIDTANRPGHEKWEYYCERLYSLHMAAQEALREAGNEV